MHGQVAFTAAAYLWSHTRLWFLERGASTIAAAFSIAAFGSVDIVDGGCVTRSNSQCGTEEPITSFGRTSTAGWPAEMCSSSERMKRNQIQKATEQGFHGIFRDVGFRRLVCVCSCEGFRSPYGSTWSLPCIECGNEANPKINESRFSKRR